MEFGTTNGERMVESMIREARWARYRSWSLNVILIAGILAIFKYLFT